jgi:hypothetical protein
MPRPAEGLKASAMPRLRVFAGRGLSHCLVMFFEPPRESIGLEIRLLVFRLLLSVADSSLNWPTK